MMKTCPSHGPTLSGAASGGSEASQHPRLLDSLETIGSEGVLHGGVCEHEVAFQHVQSQRVHPERVVQREGVHLEAGDVGQSVGDLLGQTRRRVSCRSEPHPSLS